PDEDRGRRAGAGGSPERPLKGLLKGPDDRDQLVRGSGSQLPHQPRDQQGPELPPPPRLVPAGPRDRYRGPFRYPSGLLRVVLRPAPGPSHRGPYRCQQQDQPATPSRSRRPMPWGPVRPPPPAP